GPMTFEMWWSTDVWSSPTERIGLSPTSRRGCVRRSKHSGWGLAENTAAFVRVPAGTAVWNQGVSASGRPRMRPAHCLDQERIMTSTILTGIGELTTNDDELGKQHNCAVVLDGDRVVWVGSADRAPAADVAIDVEGRAVLPGWVDSHTHLVFAGDRTAEFGARMSGEPYRAGGIAVTVDATRAATDEELAQNLRRHVAEAISQGTT